MGETFGCEYFELNYFPDFGNNVANRIMCIYVYITYIFTDYGSIIFYVDILDKRITNYKL